MNDKRKAEVFNSGYILSKYRTEVSDQIQNIKQTESELVTTLQAGIKQHQLDKSLERKNELKRIRDSKSNERDKER